MNVAHVVIFVLEIITVFTRTEAFPNWTWGSEDKNKWWSHHHHHSDTYHSCAVGQCVLACNCPKSTVVSESKTDSCIYREHGPWVCCLVNDDSFHHRHDANIYSSDSPNKFKHTTIKLLKVSTASSIQNHGYDKYNGTQKPPLKDASSKNEDDIPLVRSIGSPLKNDSEVYRLYRTKNKTARTKIPNISVTNNLSENYNKSKTSTNYKQTSLWNKSHTLTSNLNSFKRTTKLPDKFRTLMPNTNYYTKTTFVWEKSRTSTSRSDYYKKTGNLWDKPYTSMPNIAYKNTTNLWGRPHPSEPRIIFPSDGITRHYAPNPPTKRPWIQSTSTKAAWKRIPVNTRRTMSTTTKHPHSERSTVTTRPSTEKSNQNWRSSTTTHSARTLSKPKTTRPSSVHSTTKSTRRYSVTTLLPNVNVHLCGLRNELTTVRRQARNGYYGHNPIVDTVYSGSTRSRSRLPFQRIVGGKEAEPFAWPWVAALYKVTSSGGNRFLSAGSLINEDFILTAAHVFTPEDLRSASYVVMLGTHDAQDAVAQYVVSSVMLHPNYEHRYYYNDIALLKLERKVVFNNYIMPICLPSPIAPLHMDRDLFGKNVTVMGWGDDSFGGKSSQVLKEATFPVVSRVSCNASYVRVASNRFPKGITAEMLCAGDPKGGKDACQGDSGGPLTVIANGRFTQVGIVSFGYKCGDKEFPGVYTKVAPYLSWIAENTKYVADYDYYG